MSFRPSCRWRLLVSLLLAGLVTGCEIERNGIVPGDPEAFSPAMRSINVDGSSTVSPISMALAEVFEDAHPEFMLKVERSGTGGGLEKFSRGECQIANASRPIKPSEAEACRKNGIEFTEIHLGMDGLTVVVNPQNTWCNALTVEQLARMWSKTGNVSRWSDIDPTWPNEPLKLFGPDSKSGTYDYFKEETVGKDNPMRADYQPNSDDNVLVAGVAGDKFALGYFGFAYFLENREKVRPVAIVPPGQPVSAAVLPSIASIESGEYKPLSRPLLFYVSNAALQRQEVRDFTRFHLSDEGQKLVALKGFVPLNSAQLAQSRARLDEVLPKSSPSLTTQPPLAGDASRH